MKKRNYAVLSAALVFNAVRIGFPGISEKRGSPVRNAHFHGASANEGPLVRYNGEVLENILDQIQAVAKSDFSTEEDIKVLVSAGLSGVSVQVALYPFLSDELANDIIVRYASLLEKKALFEGKNHGDVFLEANNFLVESLGISREQASEYFGFIIEQMLPYVQRLQGGVIEPRVAVS